MRLHFVRLVLVVLLLVAGQATAARAQDSTATAGSPWLIGGSVGVPGIEGNFEPRAFTLGLHFSRLRPLRPGPDLSIGVLPRAITEGIVALGARGGVAVAVPLGIDAALIPSGGVSVLGAVGSDAGDAVAGVHGGIALAVRGDPNNMGVRVGISGHRFNDFDATIWLFEVGIARIPSFAR